MAGEVAGIRRHTRFPSYKAVGIALWRHRRTIKCRCATGCNRGRHIREVNREWVDVGHTTFASLGEALAYYLAFHEGTGLFRITLPIGNVCPARG